MPFSLTPNTEFYCRLPNHQEVFNVLSFALQSGEGFVKVVGEVGSGKTLICRQLLNYLDAFVTLYMPNPNYEDVKGLYTQIADELDLQFTASMSASQLLKLISDKLIALSYQDQSIILVIDEAQVLTDACLEAIRLLTNLETEHKRLLQIVFFAQPELDERLNQHALRQLKQRITFSCVLNPLVKRQVADYIAHRLAIAGHTYGQLFTKKACDLIYEKSQGIPRIINILCHKALLVAYGKGKYSINTPMVKKAIDDTDCVKSKSNHLVFYSTAILTACVMSYVIIKILLAKLLGLTHG